MTLNTAVIITCPDTDYAQFYMNELEKRKNERVNWNQKLSNNSKHFMNEKTIILVAEDAKRSLGSGGATINALFLLTEYLSAKQSYTVINPNVLRNVLVLIIHLGRVSIFEPRGNLLLPMPLSISPFFSLKSSFGLFSSPDCYKLLDYIFDLMDQLLNISPPSGTWVFSSDMIMELIRNNKEGSVRETEVGGVLIPSDVIFPSSFDLSDSDACALTVKSGKGYAKNHGFVQLDQNMEFITNIHYKCSDDEVINTCFIKDTNFNNNNNKININNNKKNNKNWDTKKNDSNKKDDRFLPLISGILYLAWGTSSHLLTLHHHPFIHPLLYLAEDSHTFSLKLSVFFDILLAMCPGCSEEKFIEGNGNIKNNYEQLTRGVVYKQIHHFKCKNLLLNAKPHYLNPKDEKDFIKVFKENIFQNNTENNNNNNNISVNTYIKSEKSFHEKKNFHLPVFFDSLPLQSISSMVINSILNINDHQNYSNYNNLFISNSFIEGENINIGKNCNFFGLVVSKMGNKKFSLPDDTSIIAFNSSYENENENETNNKSIFLNNSSVSNENVEKKISQRYIIIKIKNKNFIRKRNLYNIANNFTNFYKIDNNNKKYENNNNNKNDNKNNIENENNRIEGIDVDLTFYDDTNFIENFFSNYFDENNKLSNITKSIENPNNNINEENDLIDNIVSHVDLKTTCHLYNLIDKKIILRKVRSILVNNLDINMNQHMKHFISLCGYNHFNSKDYDLMLKELDQLLYKNISNKGLCARILAVMADFIGEIAREKKEFRLRSGPAGNKQWLIPFSLLSEDKYLEAYKEMEKVRQEWIGSYGKIIRCSRHYEGASQILIRKAVLSAYQFSNITKLEKIEMIPLNQWIVFSSPCRLDLAGGWTDTPPISYELGGLVLNVAITIHEFEDYKNKKTKNNNNKNKNKNPIGACIRRIKKLEVKIHLEEGGVLNSEDQKDLSFLSDHNRPSAPACLVKACLLSSGVLDLHTPLNQQLIEKFQSGIEIKTWSRLPHGSGLGTSSILAGNIIACLWTLKNWHFDQSHLIHSVLCTEQLMTTGGGWQDQVGGLYGGFKLGKTEPGIPIHITVKSTANNNYNNNSDKNYDNNYNNDGVKIEKKFIEEFNDRLLLVYTGQTRLAKNILQSVIRSWYARDESIVNIMKKLCKLAQKGWSYVNEGNLNKLCEVIINYNNLKKELVASSETVDIKETLSLLKPICQGYCMAGAGGGGFIYLILKEELDPQVVTNCLNCVKAKYHVKFYRATLSSDGITRDVEAPNAEN